MTTELWQFQEEDVSELEEVRAVLLGLEMGCGKTLEAIERDHRIRARHVKRPVTLVVCKLGATHRVWAKWFKQQYPELDIEVIDPKNRPTFLSWVEAYRQGLPAPDVFIVHWEALRLMPELRKVTWTHIIADEVHKIKGRKTQQTRALKALPCLWKTALSGTAADNKPQDLWSTLNWLYPQTFRSYWKFYEHYIEYEIVYPQGYHKMKGVQNVEELRELIKPFYRRHLKKKKCCEHHPVGVMPWLPDKYYDTMVVDLGPEQRRAYEQMRKTMVAWVGEQDQERPIVAPVVISQLQRLQQFALGYATIDETGKVRIVEPSSKLDLLMDIIEDLEGKQLVVFSQFKDPLYLLEGRCIDKGYSIGLYTGDNPKERDAYQESFQSGQLQIFAGTIAAGGESIDLTSASTVVFLDRAWSPSQNKQAEDRLWRGGQENGVQVIDIIARNTVDLGRIQQIEQKWSWITAILDPTFDNVDVLESSTEPPV